MKLAQENDKLKAELRGMSERLEAVERKRLEIARQQELRDQKMREVQAAMEAQQALEEHEEEHGEHEEENEEQEEVEEDHPGPDNSHGGSYGVAM
jgi:ABC-type Zn2+ transport system substrate-binding protein/surface adhesin